MAAQKILRIRRTDADGDAAYALLSIESAGPLPLDVKLVGTEGENVFAASVREAQIREFRTRAGDDREWEAILRNSLLQNPAEGDDAKVLENLEIVASVSDQRLNLTVRKNIKGITQRLGVIPLAEDRDTEIEFFEWTAIAVEAASAARDEARELQIKHEAQQLTINDLKSRLDDVVQAKKDHDSALLAKFQGLLNAKKLKIRDQQRLLAGAKVDPAAAAAVETARGTTRHGTRPRKAGPSRASKRKANAKTPITDSESEPDDARMEVDEGDAAAKLEGAGEEDIAELATPETSDPDATEDEDDGGFSIVPDSHPANSGVGAKGKAIKTAAQNPSLQRQESPDAPPPRRELPFTKDQGKQPRNEPVKKAPPPAAQDDDEESTTEDEP